MNSCMNKDEWYHMAKIQLSSVYGKCARGDDLKMLRIFKQLDVRNRAYVIDNKGNKLFYGTVYQCGKFINYMNEWGADDESGVKWSDREIDGKQVGHPVEQ